MRRPEPAAEVYDRRHLKMPNASVKCHVCLDSGRTIDVETLDVVPCRACKRGPVKWPGELRGLLAWWDQYGYREEHGGHRWR